jgi:hypothetical protein
MTTSTVTTAAVAAVPPRTASGTIIAAITDPGSAFRTLRVASKEHSHQPESARADDIGHSRRRTYPDRRSFASLVEAAARISSGDRTRNDEPPSLYEAFDNDGDDPRDHPAGGTARSRPQRHQHCGEKCRHHKIEPVSRRIDDQPADEISDARSRKPACHATFIRKRPDNGCEQSDGTNEKFHRQALEK